MPLKKGTSKKTIGANIREFHTGKTYARTKAKFGKKKADQQAVAAALEQQQRSGSGKRSREREKRTKKRRTRAR